MKIISKLFILFFLIGSISNAQIHDPVEWKTTVEKVSDSEFNLVITANIEYGWHLYSQTVPDGGPIPTTFTFEKNNDAYQLLGTPTEGEGYEEYDKVFEMDIKYFDTKAIFKQKIRLLTKDQIKIKGVLEFMVCDDTRCLPPTEVDLSFDLQGEAADETLVSEAGKEKSKITGIPKKDKQKSLWTLFILSFFAGFAALLTPCVFPMIPMTVSFFTKQSKTKALGLEMRSFSDCLLFYYTSY